MTENTQTAVPEEHTQSRELPARISIPSIRGEMVHLRPATIADLDKLDALNAYHAASRITGKDRVAERAVVHTWVRRSVAWSEGQLPNESGVGDPEARRTIAWAVLTDADHDADRQTDAASTGNVIGMMFLIDIDGWARSARIQVILGEDYRGRGYSRDLMPRVMTYGFAPEPAGLGMHRIWVAVPEQNTRSVSVYQSLGFVPSGTSRDALWDAAHNKYQDLIVMDTTNTTRFARSTPSACMCWKTIRASRKRWERVNTPCRANGSRCSRMTGNPPLRQVRRTFPNGPRTWNPAPLAAKVRVGPMRRTIASPPNRRGGVRLAVGANATTSSNRERRGDDERRGS